MKLFTAGLATETNTLSPIPTGWSNYRVVRGGVGEGPLPTFEAPLQEFRRLAREEGWELTEGLCAHATPSGKTVRQVYEQLRDEILAQLRAVMPVDAVLLNLHGAMVADGYDDCEGDLLGAIRALTGAALPIGAELDLHCHLTQAMLRHASCLVIYKEYPHLDSRERAVELFSIIKAAVNGSARPTPSVFTLPMLGLYPTNRQPMARIVEQMKEAETQPGVLSVSLAHGFPWADVPDLGARMLVYTDGPEHREHGNSLARELGLGFYAHREQVRVPYIPLQEAMGEALAATQTPVVLVDTPDNVGGGGPGDSTALLHALLAMESPNAAFCLYDPIVVQLARSAGVGATLRVRLGGKLGAVSGAPADLTAKVVKITEALTQTFLGAPSPMGQAVRLSRGSLDIIVTSERCMTVSPEPYEHMDIDPFKKRILVSKACNNARPGFDRVAAHYLYVDYPGACPGDLTPVTFRKFNQPFWPRDPDPIAAQ